MRKKCNPRQTIAYERHIFNTCNQSENEFIDEYFTNLEILASSCEFEKLKDSLIRHIKACGVRNENVRLRLLKEDKLTQQKKLDISRASEASGNHLKPMANGSPKLIDGQINA